MTLASLTRLGIGAARHRLTGKRSPLTVFWSVTNQCDTLCEYCETPFRTGRETTPDEALAIAEQLVAESCQVAVLTGGEPLTRVDLAALVGTLATAGIHIELHTNGYAWPERADELRGVGHLVVAVDGPEHVHDAIREPGSFAKAAAAIADAIARRIPVSTHTVITANNVDHLEEVIDLAEAWGATARFRLLHDDGTMKGSDACSLAPSPAAVRRALLILLEARREKRPVALTEKTLRTLLSWQDFDRMKLDHPREDQHCLAGQTHFYIDADGSLYACSQVVGDSVGTSLRTEPLDKAIYAACTGGCQACAVAELTELNQLTNFNLPTVFGRLRDTLRHGPPPE